MSKPDDQLPKEFLAKMNESTTGYYQFDTSAPGPFLLPLLDHLESVDMDAHKNMTFRFRDKDQKKRFDILVSASLIPDLYEMIATIYNNFEKIGKPPNKQKETSS